MGAAVNITSLVIGALFAFAFALQYFRFRQPSYIAFLTASVFYLISDSINLAFSLQAKSAASPDHTKLSSHLQSLLFSAYTFSILGVQVTTQEVTRLVRTWSFSMEAAAQPGSSRCKTAVKISTWLYWTFYVLAMGEVVATALTLWVSPDFALVAALFVLFFCICLTMQLALCAWLWASMRNAEGTDYAFKRGQMMVLLLLVLLTPAEHMLSAYILSRKPVRWIFYNAIALWPGNLMEIDKKVDVYAQDFKSGVEEMVKQDGH